MGRDTWFYKLNKEVAKEKLLPELKYRSDLEESFKNFIDQRNQKYRKENDYISYLSILHKVEMDINQILASELSEIKRWFEQKWDDDNSPIWANLEAFYEKLGEYGLENMFDLDRSRANCFMLQFGRYYMSLDFTTITEKEYLGHNIISKDFIGFLDYMMVLMAKLIPVADEADLDYYSKFIYEAEVIGKQHSPDSDFWKLVEWQVEELSEIWNNRIFRDESELEETTLHYAGLFLESCVNMKQSISEINSNIIIVDSI